MSVASSLATTSVNTPSTQHSTASKRRKSSQNSGKHFHQTSQKTSPSTQYTVYFFTPTSPPQYARYLPSSASLALPSPSQTRPTSHNPCVSSALLHLVRHIMRNVGIAQHTSYCLTLGLYNHKKLAKYFPSYNNSLLFSSYHGKHNYG
jgi:hypothetical protein